MKQLMYMFGRDFNLWTNQLINRMYRTSIPKLWGRGLKDQLVHFTGRATIWYRYEDEHNKLKEYIVNKPLDHEIFNQERYDEFCKDVDKTRDLHKIKEVKDDKEHYLALKNLFLGYYPVYPIGVFITGIWNKEFLAVHGEEGQKVIDRITKARDHTEGVLKETDNYMREWLGNKLENRSYFKVMTVDEVDDFVFNNKVPNKDEMEERLKGFMYMDDKVYPTTDIKEFLKNHDLEIKQEKVDDFKGRVICEGGIIKGNVRVVMNSHEARFFQEGEILVTTMTAPDYLPAIMKSKMVITDEGSMTCHIAITAREFNKPAIMGTKIATKVLNDGDLIEVDTKTGIIKKI